MRQPFGSTFPVLATALFALASCAGTTEKAESVQRVDDLLAHVECVQVDSVVSKEASRAALDQLDAICSPTFAGDAKDGYAQLLDKIQTSEKQARKLRGSMEPMRMSAESVFRQWTADLESFGSTRMRQRSQTRLDETQARYRNLYATAQSALIAYDAFNGDLRDHALFLSHDMNASAVAELAGDVKVLRDVLLELDGRMDACAAAARAYVEAAALYGQTGEESAEATSEEPAAKETSSAKRRTSTLRRSTTPAPAEPAPPAANPAPIGPSPSGTDGAHESPTPQSGQRSS
jgi:hypothetical protein